MRIGVMVAGLALAAGMAACQRAGGGGTAGGGAADAQRTQASREDSVRRAEKALRDSGVTFDTQTVDTGGAAPPAAEDN